MVNQKEINSKLLKIAENQQKILRKLAQDNAEGTADAFVKSMTSAWLVNNVVKAKYRVHLEKSNDPNFDYVVEMMMAPVEGMKVSPDSVNKYKEYMAAKVLENPYLKGKKVKVNATLSPTI